MRSLLSGLVSAAALVALCAPASAHFVVARTPVRLIRAAPAPQLRAPVWVRAERIIRGEFPREAPREFRRRPGLLWDGGVAGVIPAPDGTGGPMLLPVSSEPSEMSLTLTVAPPAPPLFYAPLQGAGGPKIIEISPRAHSAHAGKSPVVIYAGGARLAP